MVFPRHTGQGLLPSLERGSQCWRYQVFSREIRQLCQKLHICLSDVTSAVCLLREVILTFLRFRVSQKKSISTTVARGELITVAAADFPGLQTISHIYVPQGCLLLILEHQMTVHWTTEALCLFYHIATYTSFEYFEVIRDPSHVLMKNTYGMEEIPLPN
jgi:hypothetical protein